MSRGGIISFENQDKLKIGVGIIVTSPLNPVSWAKNVNIPAIKALPEEYEIN